jgi:hypothetical protein
VRLSSLSGKKRSGLRQEEPGAPVVRERMGVYYSTEPLLENERMQLGTMGCTMST